MRDVNPTGELPLPDELRALDAEISSIRYEERPSFGPELRAELERAWQTRSTARRPVARHLAAAGIAGLLVAAVAVPSARASLVRLLGGFDSGGVVAELPPPPPADLASPPPTRAAEAVAEESETEPAPEPPALVLEEDPVVPTPPTAPQMLDRARAEHLLRAAYPDYLQSQGVGGMVWLKAWVDANGLTSLASVSRSSGVRDLDRAALEVVPLLRFSPAVQNGAPTGTWIEFSVLFEPDETERAPLEPLLDDPLRLPGVRPSERWEMETPLTITTLPEWNPEYDGGRRMAEGALALAIGGSHLDHIGPVRAILAGVAPEGHAPTEWRRNTAAVLEEAVAHDPTNPAPLLALGRIRLRQGLRTDARVLFERGLRIAIENERSVPPSIFAELHLERGRLVGESWRASHRAGRVRATAFEARSCPQASPAGTAANGFASSERLIAWNYLCPAELDRVFESGFEPRADDGADLSLMMASFRAAIDKVPGHAGANVALLIELADDARWDDVLAGARRFARRSGGHPEALLLSAIALHRLGFGDRAAVHFQAALERLPQAEAEAIRDVTPILSPEERVEYRRLWGEERRAWEVAWWAARDRSPGAAADEREVEHLARSAWAHLRFGGAASDPGGVWVRFGGPNTIHVVDDGSGQLTEFWDYGSGPDITFARSVASQAMDLTPEGRAYVDDLGNVFPPQ